jgi:hypothetical protein
MRVLMAEATVAGARDNEPYMTSGFQTRRNVTASLPKLSSLSENAKKESFRIIEEDPPQAVISPFFGTNQEVNDLHGILNLTIIKKGTWTAIWDFLLSEEIMIKRTRHLQNFAWMDTST